MVVAGVVTLIIGIPGTPADVGVGCIDLAGIGVLSSAGVAAEPTGIKEEMNGDGPPT